MARVVIVGGGIAGLTIANTLASKAKGKIDVTVVTKESHYMSGPSRPLILTGEQRYERIIRGYGALGSRGLKVEYGLVTRVDPGERKVYLADNPTRPAGEISISYDYLVIAPGVVFDGYGIKGYREHGWRVVNVYEPGRLDMLKTRIWSETSGDIVVYAPQAPYRCAPAPAETAFAIHTVLKHRGVRENFRIVHIDANDKPQPPVISDVIAKLYEETGIQLITNSPIEEIGPDYVVTASGERIKYTILAMLEPNRAPRFIAEAGLGERWVEVRNPNNLRTVKYDDVLAAGDAAKLPFPKNQEIAYQSGLQAAYNIIEALGLDAPEPVTYTFLGWAYVGNPNGALETLSVRFGLNYATQPPKPSKDPQPSRKYTLDKDNWEQGYLNSLYGYTPAQP